MHVSNKTFATLCLATFLLVSPRVFGQDADSDAKSKALAIKADAAYVAKDYGTAAQFYLAAANGGPHTAVYHYNAACSYALAGQADAAFRELQAAIDSGNDGSPAGDRDFASLHSDPRWEPLVARYEARHPGEAVMKVLRDQTLPLSRRYAAGWGAVGVTDTTSTLNQVYGNHAQFVGDYDVASRIYGFPKPVDDVVAAGFTHAVDAIPVVLAQAHGRLAVFLNESHGQSQTRAANFALLAGLRADGFYVLAMEALGTGTTTPADTTGCRHSTLFDAELPARGYPLDKTGFYSQDPLYAETVREALRLGFRLVAYDSPVPPSIPVREQNQAEQLACVFKKDPKARMVVVAGFSHIGERKDFFAPGGAMAYRFRTLSGIDPLSVDTTTQLHLDPAKLRFPHITAMERRPVSYVLENAAGKPYRTDNFDLVLYVPAPSHREDGQPGWLDLGGARKATPVDVPACGTVAPCIVQARRNGELAEAVPGDGCVLANATHCTLFLRPGRYDVVAVDGQNAVLERVSLVIQ